MRKQIRKPYINGIRLLYTRTVYGVVYGIVHGAVNRSYKKNVYPCRVSIRFVQLFVYEAFFHGPLFYRYETKQKKKSFGKCAFGCVETVHSYKKEGHF